jgi:hypothetical protein
MYSINQRRILKEGREKEGTRRIIIHTDRRQKMAFRQ